MTGSIVLAGLLSCQTPPPEPVVQPIPDEPEPDVDIEALEAAYREELRQQLEVADILYQAMRALGQDRLMTPPEGSALSLFNRVLGMQPDNAVARQGLEDIASRYLQLADDAARQGHFDNAQLYLQRAETVSPDHEGLAAAARALEQERQRTHSVHPLNHRQLSARSQELIDQLQTLAAQANELGAFIMITAPNDTHGRWIYTQMQETTQQRLRADIEIGEQATVRLVLQPARS